MCYTNVFSAEHNLRATVYKIASLADSDFSNQTAIQIRWSNYNELLNKYFFPNEYLKVATYYESGLEQWLTYLFTSRSDNKN